MIHLKGERLGSRNTQLDVEVRGAYRGDEEARAPLSTQKKNYLI